MQLKLSSLQGDELISNLLAKHRKELDHVAETAKSKFQQLHMEQESVLNARLDKIRELEEMIKKLQLQIAVQDSYWRKKEQQLLEGNKEQISSIHSINSSLQQTHAAEMDRFQKLIRHKDESILQRESEIIALKNQIGDLKSNAESAIKHREHNLAGMDFQLQEYTTRVNHLQHEKEQMQRVIKASASIIVKYNSTIIIIVGTGKELV